MQGRHKGQKAQVRTVGLGALQLVCVQLDRESAVERRANGHARFAASVSDELQKVVARDGAGGAGVQLAHDVLDVIQGRLHAKILQERGDCLGRQLPCAFPVYLQGSVPD